MARLVVEAQSSEWVTVDVVYEVLVAVSVSRADSGTPVTGLTTRNFRVAVPYGLVQDFKVVRVSEAKWEPEDVDLAGIYQLEIVMSPAEEFVKGERYVFGVQARTFDGSAVVDRGQTVVELISMGR
jgi:hypothetical protein